MVQVLVFDHLRIDAGAVAASEIADAKYVELFGVGDLSVSSARFQILERDAVLAGLAADHHGCFLITFRPFRNQRSAAAPKKTLVR